MLDSTQVQAREMIIEQIEKLVEKTNKKAEKENAKKKNVSVTYKGEQYHTEAELQEAYACDVFTSATFDRLVEKLNKARGNVESYEMTPSECLGMELEVIRNNLMYEIKISDMEKKKKAEHEARFQELQEQGYSYREAETIIGNEEMMRYE